MFKNSYHKRHFFLMFQMILSSFMSFSQLRDTDGGNGPGTGLSEGEEKLLNKIKEQSEKQIAAIVKSTLDKFDEKIKEANTGNISLEDYNSFKESIKGQLNDMNLSKESLTDIHEKHAELLDVLKEQGEEIKRIKITSKDVDSEKKVEFNALTTKQKFKVLLEKALQSDDFKDWERGNFRKHTPSMDIKAVIGEGANHTGPIFVTEPKNNVRDIPRMQPHMRDYLNVGNTDEAKVTFPEVKDYTDIYTLGTQMLAENEAVTDVTFNSIEQTSTVVRLGVSMSISQRYFRGRTSVIIDHVINQVPDALMFKEDVQIINGDGAGDNLDGIITDARAFDLTPNTYAAGAISSVATYDGGTKALITFAAAHGLLSGDKITIANATETTYNATHEDILLIDENKIVINLTYVAEADTSAWTGTGLSYWYQSVDGAQEFDVLSAAASILEAGLYSANAIFVNPQTTRRLGTLKGSDLHYIGVSRDAAGRLNMDGIPIISIPVIPAGWFLIGDFSAKNIEILDYKDLSIQFLEDVTTKKENSVVILADEELHLVKYNPKWYIYDRFSTAKTQLETP